MPSRARALAFAVVLVGGLLGAAGGAQEPAAAHGTNPPYVDGGAGGCGSWKIVFADLGFFELGFDIAEEGWVWIDAAQKLQSASGVVVKSKIPNNDTPSNHFSHDWDMGLRVDPGQEHVLSDVNGKSAGSPTPNTLGIEWETGVRPGEKSGDGAHPFIPRWVFPSKGDRLWTDGHWVFDCGHPTTVKTPIPEPGNPASCPEGTKSRPIPGTSPVEFEPYCSDDHFKSEIHPPRAVASMRSQSVPLPGSGTTPVPVTATDLYIHGHGAFMVQQLECGIGTILSDTPHSCPRKDTEIADDYSFDVCLPPQPAPQARLAWAIADGPDNTRREAPDIAVVEATGGCDLPADEFGNDFDDDTMLRVSVALANSNARPEDVYARRIVAGWVYPTDEPMRHLSVRMDQMDLHDDHEAPGFNGEMSFLWMGVDRAPLDEWYRLVNFEIPTNDGGDGFGCGDAHINRLNDYDDDGLCGNGLLNFSGPDWQFYLRAGQSFAVHSTGFEQDCYDDHFGSGDFSLLDYADCHANPAEAFNYGNNDGLPPVDATYGSDVPAGRYEPSADGAFELEFVVTQIPPADEDTADLSVDKSCAQDTEVPLAGEPFTCTITVTNHGPGLPRAVNVTDTLVTALDPSAYVMGAPEARVGVHSAVVPCTVTPPNTFDCAIGSIPVGENATVTVQVTATTPGTIDNVATVSTASADPDATNDTDHQVVIVYLPVDVEVKAGRGDLPAVNTGSRGVMSAAVLTTPDFDATSVNPLTVCFGDEGDPAQRDCTEVHGVGHREDVDKDRDTDLLMHFEVAETGIDPGDSSSCLIGFTTAGTGVYGCDVIQSM